MSYMIGINPGGQSAAPDIPHSPNEHRQNHLYQPSKVEGLLLFFSDLWGEIRSLFSELSCPHTSCYLPLYLFGFIRFYICIIILAILYCIKKHADRFITFWGISLPSSASTLMFQICSVEIVYKWVLLTVNSNRITFECYNSISLFCIVVLVWSSLGECSEGV